MANDTLFTALQPLNTKYWILNTNRPSTSVEKPLQIGLFMQNEPNFKNHKMNINNVLIKTYENISIWTLGENEPKQTQFVVSLPALSKAEGSNLSQALSSKNGSFTSPNLLDIIGVVIYNE